ncbi:MAG: tetratricopeptide repeat protein, partial [Bacteroidota bacterium]
LELDRILNEAGIYAGSQGDSHTAISLLRRSVEIRATTRSEEPLEKSIAYSNLALQLQKTADFLSEAEKYHRLALEIDEKYLPANHPDLAITLSNIGTYYNAVGDFEKSVSFAERALEIDKNNMGPTSFEFGIRAMNLGSTYSEWGAISNNIDLMTKGHKLLLDAESAIATSRGVRHPNMPDCLYFLARSYAVLSRELESADVLIKAIAIKSSLNLHDHPFVDQCSKAMGRYLYISIGKEKADTLIRNKLENLEIEILEVEEQHRKWVKIDPDNRSFGVKSLKTGASS